MPPRALILPTHTPSLFEAAVEQAVQHLVQGGVIGLPTETVYGLAANAFNPDAVRKIYAIKGRPERNPIIAHIATLEMAQQCVAAWPDQASRLAETFWPGPLTLVLPKSDKIPTVLTAGGSTVGIRWPSHPFMQAVLQRCPFPIAAPSANLANQLSPTNAEHVLHDLGDRIPLIVDGGQCQVGIESTVVDLTQGSPRVLRPGMIDEVAILRSLGKTQLVSTHSPEHQSADGTLMSPGQLAKHYSPKARLLVLSWETEADFQQLLHQHAAGCRRIHVVAYQVIPSSLPEDRISVIPHDAEAYARALYSELHRCDAEGADLILVEQVPQTSEWQGITDRLRRAATNETPTSPSMR